MTELQFEPAEIPASAAGRKAGPNEFDAPVSQLAEAHKAGKPGTALAVTVPYKTDEDKAAAKTMRGRIQRTGAKHGVTVQTATAETAKGNKLTITFWVRDKISRKPTVTASSTDAAASSTDDAAEFSAPTDPADAPATAV